MRPIFGRVGGKSKIAHFIVKLFPKHQIYVEPFIGGASVYFNKPSAPKLNIINDLDKDIYDMYNDITLVSDVNSFNFDDTVHDKETFQRMLHTHYKNPKKRLYRNLYLSYLSHAGNRKTMRNPIGNKKKNTGLTLKKNFQWYQNKLRNTIILNEDYKTVIQTYDSPETFFYLDPPYSKLDQSWGYSENNVSREELIRVLLNIKGKFLLSYDYSEENINLFGKYFNVKFFDHKYRLSGSYKNIKEMIITNYHI